LHTLQDVSPYERIIKLARSFGSRGLAAAACFLFFCFFSVESHADENTGAAAPPASCEVKKPQASKAKPKPTAQPAVTSKTAVASKPKPKPAAQPLVSAKTKAKAEAITSEIAPVLPSNLEQEISKFFGLRYRFGGEGQSGIDCSALVKQVYSDVFGVSLPRSSSEQSRLGSLDSVPRDDLKMGDLVFFGANRKKVNHVGMYLAGGHFLHAARSEGVTISRLDDGYWKSRFMFSKRMRGIELSEEGDDDLELHRDMMRDSMSFAFGSDDADVRFLDFGIKLNDSLEFLLSGFFLNSLEDPGLQSPMPSPAELSGPEPSKEGESGFRLATIFSPWEWFKLIPSVTQVEGVKDERNRDYQKLGLETWMILPTSGMAVFMAAHARNQDDLQDRPLGVNPDWQTMDVALGLHYHLSDSLRFSLWGTHAYTPEAKAVDDSARRNAPLDEMSFQLNIKF
jgi:cell wall-associated NlpC family hydrolase